MVRIMLAIIIIIPIIVLIKKGIKKRKNDDTHSNLNKKQIVIGVVIIVITYLFLYNIISYPFETYILDYNSSEDIFNYFNPTNKINKKIETKKYAYFISKKSGTEIMSCNYYIKTHGWHADVNNKYGRVVEYDNTFTFDPTAPKFIITELYEENKIMIYVRFKSSDKGLNISDSKNSDIIDINRTGIDWYGKLIILDSKKIDYSDYYININNVKYTVLTNKNIKRKSYR